MQNQPQCANCGQTLPTDQKEVKCEICSETYEVTESGKLRMSN